MPSCVIPESSSLDEACGRFLDDLNDWVGCCIRDLSDEPAIDGHDQGTFTTSWGPVIRTRRHTDALAFMKQLRDKVRDHCVGTGLWHHGYWTMQEAHHGTEHFELFLGTLWGLDPDDADTVDSFVDAAEHLGNWVPDVPPWFDWDTGLFRSMHFGTAGVKTDPGEAVNVPDHLRCVRMALIAHRMTGTERYLDMAVRHASRWADAILADDELPVALLPGGAVYAFDAQTDHVYRQFAGQVARLRIPVDRAENFLASGAVAALLDLWRTTAAATFRLAAERLLDVMAPHVADPDAGPAIDALRAYRERTGDTRHDSAVLEAAGALTPYAFTELGMAVDDCLPGKPSGIGKRADLPVWTEDGRPRRHNPILLAHAAELTSDRALATRAVDLARAYLALAREAFPHGREHGCSARTVNAIARGHGRNNGAGVVTAVLGPMMAWSAHGEGRETAGTGPEGPG